MPAALDNVLIVVPAFNEEASVGDVVTEIRLALPGAAVLVIDDGSADATAEQARAAGALVARLPFNLGVGGAMRTGFRYGLEHGFRAVVQVDADGQHDPIAVPELLAGLRDADIVLGARFAGKGDYEVRGPRAWAMKLFARILSRTARAALTDTTSGFRAWGPLGIALCAEHYPAEYLGDTIEILVIASRAGLRIKQVPVAMRRRTAGVPSHNAVKSAIYLGRAAMALMIAYLRPRSEFIVRETA